MSIHRACCCGCPLNATIDVSFSSVVVGVDCYLPSGGTQSRGIALASFNGTYTIDNVGSGTCRFSKNFNYTGYTHEASGSFVICDPAGTNSFTYQSATIQVFVFFQSDSRFFSRISALLLTKTQLTGPALNGGNNEYFFDWIPGMGEEKTFGDTISNQLVSGSSQAGMDGSVVVTT